MQLAKFINEMHFRGWIGVELAFRPEHPVTRSMGQNYALCLDSLRKTLA